MNERVTADRAVEEIYDRNGLTEAEAGDFVAEKKAEPERNTAFSVIIIQTLER